jgi:hypothetical protein
MRWLGSKDSNLDCMIQSHESCHPCDGGDTESTESAVKLRFRTEDEVRVRAHRNSLINRTIRGELNGVPERIRTSDLWIRSPTLYPAELQARTSEINALRLGHSWPIPDL